MSLKQLWAPWRMEFLTGPKPKDVGCVFCTLPREEEDRKNLILYRAERIFVILNKYPYNNGHLMVVPHRHVSDFTSLTDEELLEMNRYAQHAVSALTETYRPDGYNLGMNLGQAAGAGIKDHLHLHVVPRWGGDTNFLPVIGETKAMPQHLLSSFDAMKPYFEKL